MAVNDTQPQQHDAGLLACGRDAAKVWDRAAAGRLGTHGRDCEHCQAVADNQRLLAMATTALADDTLEPPPSLVDRVMDAVLTELRPAGYLPLPTRHGRARIDRAAAAGVLRHAVDQMPALRVRSCQIRLPEASDGGSTSSATPGGGVPMARVHVSVTARFGTDLISATARVRQMIIVAAGDLLGLPVGTVDVDVVDVYEDPVQRSR